VSIREALKHDPPSPTYSCSSNSSDGISITSPKLPPKLSAARFCYVCKEKEVVAALVPCGHNMFCSSCAHVAVVASGYCPICTSHVTSMLRLHN
jgi:RNA-binding protein MEX3